MGAVAGGDPSPGTRAGGVNPAPPPHNAGAAPGLWVAGLGRGAGVGRRLGALWIGSRRRMWDGASSAPDRRTRRHRHWQQLSTGRRGRAHGVPTEPAASIEGARAAARGVGAWGGVGGGVPRIVVPVIRQQTKRPTGRRSSSRQYNDWPFFVPSSFTRRKILRAWAGRLLLNGVRPQNEGEALAWTPMD